MYKVYKYTNIINKKIYIGITSKTLKDRAGSNGVNYKLCPNFYKDILEFGFINFKPEVLAEVNTLEEANLLEVQYISSLRSQDPSIGYNIQPGGSNFIMDDYIKHTIGERVRKSNKFIKNNFNAHHKEVIAISIENNEITEFDSITSAALTLNCSRGSIGNCCRRYNNNRCLKGYIWIFKSEYCKDFDYISEYKNHREIVTYGNLRNAKISQTKRKNKDKLKEIALSQSKAVIRISRIDDSTTEYASVREAALKNNIKAPTNITLVCDGKRNTAGGYMWKWK